MILMFLLDLVDLRHLLDRQVRLDNHQDGLLLLHLLVLGKEWEPEVHRVTGCLCDLDHPSFNLFEWMAMMINHHNVVVILYFL